MENRVLGDRLAWSVHTCDGQGWHASSPVNATRSSGNGFPERPFFFRSFVDYFAWHCSMLSLTQAAELDEEEEEEEEEEALSDVCPAESRRKPTSLVGTPAIRFLRCLAFWFRAALVGLGDLAWSSLTC